MGKGGRGRREVKFDQHIQIDLARDSATMMALAHTGIVS